ncbi:hypothetical protein [Candidatus Ichthyocystis hellenicum]|uniref:hypothetical protein n=1 Tax=Candidatus Ichthyocystis hellenicum TaxID=1561003 RepID=UPI000B85AAC2|nr:hypothetical protein [Candidatus Ichthyocystis hellenicum]
MIDPCNLSLSHTHSGSPIQEEEQDCKTPTPAKIDILDISLKVKELKGMRIFNMDIHHHLMTSITKNGN